MGQLQLQVCGLVRYKLKEERRKPKSDGHLIKLTITFHHSWITWGGTVRSIWLLVMMLPLFFITSGQIFSLLSLLFSWQGHYNIYCISLKKSDPVFLFFPLHSLSKMNVINVSISFEKSTQQQKVKYWMKRLNYLWTTPHSWIWLIPEQIWKKYQITIWNEKRN